MHMARLDLRTLMNDRYASHAYLTVTVVRQHVAVPTVLLHRIDSFLEQPLGRAVPAGHHLHVSKVHLAPENHPRT